MCLLHKYCDFLKRGIFHKIHRQFSICSRVDRRLIMPYNGCKWRLLFTKRRQTLLAYARWYKGAQRWPLVISSNVAVTWFVWITRQLPNQYAMHIVNLKVYIKEKVISILICQGLLKHCISRSIISICTLFWMMLDWDSSSLEELHC